MIENIIYPIFNLYRGFIIFLYIEIGTDKKLGKIELINVSNNI